MKKLTLVFIVIIALITLISCAEKKGDTIVNNNTYTYVIAEDSLWEPTNGPYGAYIYDMKINKNDEIFIVNNKTIQMSNDNGKNWTTLTSSFNDTISSATVNDRFEFIVTSRNGYFWSKDKGSTWNKIFDSIPGIYYSNYGNIDSKGNVYACGITSQPYKTYIYKSSDMGKTWKESLETKTYPTNYFIDYSDNVYVTLQETTSGLISRVFSSENYGSTWNEIITLSNTGVSLSQDSKGNIYQYLGSTIYGIKRSTDHGKSWIKINVNGLYYENISKIFFSPKGNMFMSTNYGIYKSTDSGNTWIRIIKPSEGINTMCLDSKGYLFVLTSNCAIKRTLKPVE